MIVSNEWSKTPKILSPFYCDPYNAKYVFIFLTRTGHQPWKIRLLIAHSLHDITANVKYQRCWRTTTVTGRHYYPLEPPARNSYFPQKYTRGENHLSRGWHGNTFAAMMPMGVGSIQGYDLKSNSSYQRVRADANLLMINFSFCELIFVFFHIYTISQKYYRQSQNNSHEITSFAFHNSVIFNSMLSQHENLFFTIAVIFHSSQRVYNVFFLRNLSIQTERGFYAASSVAAEVEW